MKGRGKAAKAMSLFCACFGQRPSSLPRGSPAIPPIQATDGGKDEPSSSVITQPPSPFAAAARDPLDREDKVQSKQEQQQQPGQLDLQVPTDGKAPAPSTGTLHKADQVPESAQPLIFTKSCGPATAGIRTLTPEEFAKEVCQLTWVGHGGYGAVYKGIWQGAPVAVKFTAVSSLDLDGARQHEATLSKMLSHPNVVQTYASRITQIENTFLEHLNSSEAGSGSNNYILPPPNDFKSGEGFGSPYNPAGSLNFQDVLGHIGARPGQYLTQMIMEFCDRGSLHQAITKGVFKSGPRWSSKVALRALLRTGKEIAQGMCHLHSVSVIHGDLKPGNVLLMSSRADRRGFVAKVADFGLSNYCMESQISVSRWSTVSYMAPEAFSGHLMTASDVWSFGVLLWEMCTGQQPYINMEATQIVDGIQKGSLDLEWPRGCDARLIKLVRDCQQRDPANRPCFRLLCDTLTHLEAQVRVEVPSEDAAFSKGSNPLYGSQQGGTALA